MREDFAHQQSAELIKGIVVGAVVVTIVFGCIISLIVAAIWGIGLISPTIQPPGLPRPPMHEPMTPPGGSLPIEDIPR